MLFLIFAKALVLLVAIARPRPVWQLHQEERQRAERHMQQLLQQEKEEKRQADELREKLDEEEKELEETLRSNNVTAIQVEMFEITGWVATINRYKSSNVEHCSWYAC